MIDWQATRDRLRASNLALERALTPDADRLQAVLRERADKLASRERGTAQPEASLPVLVFHLASARYALALVDVEEIVAASSLTPVPGGPPELLGLINVRGEICSVLDLMWLHNYKAATVGRAGATNGRGFIIVLLCGAQSPVGLRVDELEGIGTLRAADLIEGDWAAGERCLAADGLVLLSAKAILAHPLLNEPLENAS